jgi:hypothetical protein
MPHGSSEPYVVPLGYLADPVTLPAASGHELVEETVTFDR